MKQRLAGKHGGRRQVNQNRTTAHTQMKKLSLIAALALGGLLAFSTIAMAQDADAKKDAKKGGKNRFSAEQRLERMSADLKLTDEQKPKVKAVLEETSKGMQGLRDVPQDERRQRTSLPVEEQEAVGLAGIAEGADVRRTGSGRTARGLDRLSQQFLKAGDRKLAAGAAAALRLDPDPPQPGEPAGAVEQPGLEVARAKIKA